MLSSTPRTPLMQTTSTHCQYPTSSHHRSHDNLSPSLSPHIVSLFTKDQYIHTYLPTCPATYSGDEALFFFNTPTAHRPPLTATPFSATCMKEGKARQDASPYRSVACGFICLCAVWPPKGTKRTLLYYHNYIIHVIRRSKGKRSSVTQQALFFQLSSCDHLGMIMMEMTKGTSCQTVTRRDMGSG